MNNLMDLLKKTLFAVVLVAVYFYLLGTSYDLLTKANSISNFLGFIGMTVLLVLAAIVIYRGISYMINDDGIVDKKELNEAEKQWKEHIEKQMELMKQMHEQNEALNKKPKSKTKKTK